MHSQLLLKHSVFNKDVIDDYLLFMSLGCSGHRTKGQRGKCHVQTSSGATFTSFGGVAEC